MNIRLLNKGDIILIVCIGLIAGLIVAWNTFSSASGNSHMTAEITRDGKLIKKIDLNEVKNPEYISFNEGIEQVILAEKGRIRFSESECRDNICVKSGWLTKTGDKAVCMPSKTVITIVGDHKQIDSISY
ncbi:MAG: NusG domain II-containing protein [Desulfitobacteriaceae bacterium]